MGGAINKGWGEAIHEGVGGAIHEGVEEAIHEGVGEAIHEGVEGGGVYNPLCPGYLQSTTKVLGTPGSDSTKIR